MVRRRFGRGKADNQSPVAPKVITFVKIPEVNNQLGLDTQIGNRFARELNTAIDTFYQAATPDAKEEALKSMQKAIDYVDVYSMPKNLANAEKFHSTKSSLFTQIRQAYAQNNNSLVPKGVKAPIANLLSDMSPERADKLMEILHKGKNDTLKLELLTLYGKEAGPEANKWKEFLKTHAIEFLGGGNSKNFKVVNTTNGDVKVLKVDNRLGMARHVEQHLRVNLGDVFTPIYADRQVKGNDPQGKMVSRTLLVTDLCPSGSVQEDSQKLRTPPHSVERDRATFMRASNIMSQMSQVYMDIQKNNCMFPDSKLTNWLVDSEGKLRIGDTKSFLFTENGFYKNNIMENKDLGMIYTLGFTPQEFAKPPYEVEKAHSALLGRNIYTYLTGKWPPNGRSIGLLSEPIFNSQIGAEYQKLIQDLTRDPPSSRLSLANAKDKLVGLWAKLVENKIEDLAKSLDVDLRTLAVNTLRLDKTRVGYSKSDSIAKIDSELDQVKASFDKCDEKIEQMSKIMLAGKPLVNKSNLFDQKKKAMTGATSIDDLKIKLDEFNTKMQQDMAKLAQMMTEYQKLRDAIENLKAGDDDPEMNKYLKECDKAILKRASDDKIEVQIQEMKNIKDGLERPEHVELKRIKENFLKNEKWYRNMGVKGRMIEKAMKSIPIKERAGLLQSTHKSVTDLFSALAWHRIRSVNPITKDEKINESNSAKTFIKFRKQFNEVAKRNDVDAIAEKWQKDEHLPVIPRKN
jgi:hypothetical protein